MAVLDIPTLAQILAIVGPTAVSGASIYIGARKRHDFREWMDLRQEDARRNRLLQGSFVLQPFSEVQQVKVQAGRIPIIASGSAGTGILPGCLSALRAGGLANIVGPIFIIEPDKLISLPDCLRRIPAIFHDRLFVPNYPALGGGWGGADVSHVYSEDALPLWRDDQQLQEKPFLSALRHQEKPPFVLAILSPGPSGSMAWPLLRAYADEHKGVPIYAVFVLDRDPERRKRHVAQLLDLYAKDDLVSLWVINDNTRGVEGDFDQAIAAFLLCVLQGPWLEQAPKAGWNSLADIHRLYHHRVATLRLYCCKLLG